MLHFWLKTNSTDNYSWSEARKIFESAANNLSRYPKNPIVRGKYIKCKKQYKTLVKETKRAFCENILKKIQQLEDKNSKEFWNLVRELGSKKDKNLSDNIDPEIWYDWFKKLNNANDTWSDDTYRPIIRNMRDFVPQFVKMLDKPIDVDEVKKAALKLKNGKSVGIDLISNEMIKCCVDSHFVRLIKELFNFILVESKFPTCWKQGLITPIFKSGEIYSPSDYRGITVTSWSCATADAKHLVVKAAHASQALFNEKVICAIFIFVNAIQKFLSRELSMAMTSICQKSICKL